MHLAALGEALMVSKQAGMDLNTAYEAIRISSGNLFVHETESQVTLNGSRDINFTMDLVIKDMGLFGSLAQRTNMPVEISTLVLAGRSDMAHVNGHQTLSNGWKTPADRNCLPQDSHRKWLILNQKKEVSR